ncbi:MAG: hypothetical protein SNJ74_04330 [Fimbriimonadaceae bacterium]
MLGLPTPLANFWSHPHGSGELVLWVLIALAAGFALMFAALKAPARLRFPIVATVTFVSGSFWVLFYLWPRPFNRQPGELPANTVESVGFWLQDAVRVVGDASNVLSALMLGLGIYSLLRVHGNRLIKRQRDWFFSLVLILSMITMIVFGYWDYFIRESDAELAILIDNGQSWAFPNYMRDLLFDGLLQQLDAAMFSIIAFYILSAAYRAFRVRSVEATILLSAALLVMLSLMGLVESGWNSLVDSITGGDPGHFLTNLRLTELAGWLRDTVQTSGLRAIEFGIGVGTLAIGLRIWLSLERSAVNT